MQVSAGRDGYGILCDNRFGQEALHAASDKGLWIGRPVEFPASCPLAFEEELGLDCGGLKEWPQNHIVKVLCYCHPDDEFALRAQQEASLLKLAAAARNNRLDLLVELITSPVGPVDDMSAAKLINRLYDIGIYPDWWKLEPMKTDTAWRNACRAVEDHDPHCRGIVVLGLAADMETLGPALRIAAAHPLVKGFAVGRTIMNATALQWLGGEVDDATAVRQLTNNYQTLCSLWDEARASAPGTKNLAI